MKDNILKPLFPVRKKLRLRDFDYSLNCAYFVTVCAYKKRCMFGVIENGTMNLNTNGKIVQNIWKDLLKHYVSIDNDVFTIMPNHVHGIIVIHEENWRSGSKPDPTKKYTLSEIVRAFKTYSSRKINASRHSQGTVLWQHGYFEHVIRDEKEYYEIGEYILSNATKWENDAENPGII
jgi:REP element-mobilizing transposase RayT